MLCTCGHVYLLHEYFNYKTWLFAWSVLLFALTLQSVNQNAVHMNIIMWFGFLFSL